MIRNLLLAALAAVSVTSCASFAQTPRTIPEQPPIPKGLKAELTVTRSGQVNRFGNPILLINIVTEQGVHRSFLATSGRGHTQAKDRNKAGTEAPLPNGRYRLGTVHAGPFGDSELGRDYFVDTFPMFATGRSELGIHLDPSYDRDPQEDGTAGCLGVTNRRDLLELVDLIRQHQIRTMTVEL